MTELFLVVAIAGRPVAIDALHVDAVVDVSEVVPIPRAPHAVLGLAALRSRVVTVIDSACALGIAPAEPRPSPRVVTARIDGHGYGFVVDAVEDVAAFEPQPLTVGVALAPGWRRATRGMIERGGEPILILDLAALIPQIEAVAA